MIHFETTADFRLIKQVMTHPSLWRNISDDYSGPPEEFQPSPHMLYLLAKDDEEVLGLWALHPESHTVWKCHTCLLPAAWGARARAAGKQAIEWVWANLPKCHRIVTDVPISNRLALRYAKACGFKEMGRNPRSLMKQGLLLDQIMLGISRPEVSPCQPQ